MIAQTFQPKQQKTNPLKKKKKLETGFPSPATDHLEDRLNLHDHVVQYPASTFFVKVEGENSRGLGLENGDLLVVDRSLAPKHQSLVIAELNGEHLVCRLIQYKSGWLLERGDGRQLPLQFDMAFESPIWGKVTHVIHSV